MNLWEVGNTQLSRALLEYSNTVPVELLCMLKSTGVWYDGTLQEQEYNLMGITNNL